ncbi:MAG: hypothetical protein L0Y56_10785 [Nitrospira sp.]|nr:hypothetical protein [Nitrospira sp.]
MTDTPAIAMLREELRKQPTLSIFFTTEKWKLELLPELVEDNYLCQASTMTSSNGRDWARIYWITHRARRELLENEPKE